MKTSTASFCGVVPFCVIFRLLPYSSNLSCLIFRLLRVFSRFVVILSSSCFQFFFSLFSLYFSRYLISSFFLIPSFSFFLSHFPFFLLTSLCFSSVSLSPQFLCFSVLLLSLLISCSLYVFRFVPISSCVLFPCQIP